MIRTILTTIFIFLFSLGYLHQKIALSVEAYRLTDKYAHFRQLVDKRDVLLYNLCEKTSLEEVNLWAQHNQFEFAAGEKVLALRMDTEPEAEVTPGINAVAHLAARLFKLPGESEVLAKDKTKK